MFEGKKVILVGPSKVALEGFNYSTLDNYDVVVRMNKFLESEHSHYQTQISRCDALFINSNCASFYKNKTEKLKGKKVFVKNHSDLRLLKNRDEELSVYSVGSTWSKSCSIFGPHIPYYGTVAIDYLKDKCKVLDVAGMDFYQSGFCSKSIYPEGYYDLAETNKEESLHCIKKDIKYIKKILDNNNNINLIHKTRVAFEQVQNNE